MKRRTSVSDARAWPVRIGGLGAAVPAAPAELGLMVRFESVETAAAALGICSVALRLPCVVADIAAMLQAAAGFGPNPQARVRLHVEQIDRVLRGAAPADTPILQPIWWDLLINQRLARALGGPARRSVRVQPTEVVE
jgi:putative tryptophan/tyrosine transport system substrate-binding protein